MVAEDHGFHEIATLLRQPFRPPPPSAPSSKQRNTSGGSQPWYKGKVLLAGEKRVGKTALSSSNTMGKSFVEAESTVGMTLQTGDGDPAASSSEGRWAEHSGAEGEYDAAVARMMKEMDSLRAAERESNSVPSTTTYKSISDVTCQATSISQDTKRSNSSWCGWMSRFLCGGSSKENANPSGRYEVNPSSPPDKA